MVLLDLDPNVVKPGWTPLLITLALAVVVVLLYRSMRRQFRRISIPRQEPPATEQWTTESRLTQSQPTDPDTDSPTRAGGPGAGS